MSDAKVKGSDGGQRHGDSAVAGVMLWSACMDAGGVAPEIYISRDLPSGQISPASDILQRTAAEDAAFRAVISRGPL